MATKALILHKICSKYGKIDDTIRGWVESETSSVFIARFESSSVKEPQPIILDSVPCLGRIERHAEAEYPLSIACAEDSPDQSSIVLPETLRAQQSAAQVAKSWIESNFDQNCVVAFGSDDDVSIVRPNAEPAPFTDAVDQASVESDVALTGVRVPIVRTRFLKSVSRGATPTVVIRTNVSRYADSSSSVETQITTLLLKTEPVSNNIAFHLHNIETTIMRWLGAPDKPKLSTKHFWPEFSSPQSVGFLSFLYPHFETLTEGRPWREHAQAIVGLPTDRPFLRPSMETFCKKEQSVLQNVHNSVPLPSEKGSVTLVNGSYSYFHYGQSINDSGWGCAYRSLQTLVSWLIFQGLAEGEVPSHSEIQQLLVDKKDKPRSFLNSTQWIGAVEVGLFIQSKYAIDYKILNARSGDDFDSLADQIVHHFDISGCPIMIGGGVLAYTLLGISIPENKASPVKYLILDPHYVGQERIDIIVQKGWCKWHDKSLFRKDAFYNLCLPMIQHQV